MVDPGMLHQHQPIASPYATQKRMLNKFKLGALSKFPTVFHF